MKTRHLLLSLLLGSCLIYLADDALARGGRGGGGGCSRGGGSVRYSASRSRSSSSYSRSYSSSRSVSRSSTNYRPANYGSVSGGAVRGSGGGAAVGVRGPGGNSAVAVRGPNGNTAVARSYGGSSRVVHGYGGNTAVVHGYGGNTAVMRGYGGNTAVVRYHGVGGIVHGPAGGTAFIHGSGGTAVIRARNGAVAIATLPGNVTRVAWRGGTYWYHGSTWYRPYWHNDVVMYQPIYPPVDYWYPATLTEDENPEVVVVDGKTYYVIDGVYYVKASQEGKDGYTVVADPNPPAADATSDPNLPDPLTVLKTALTYLAEQKQLTLYVNDTFEELNEQGQRISLTGKRRIYVSRPDRVSLENRSNADHRRTILDGQQLTILDFKNNAYEQVPMALPIDATLDKLSHDYGITVAAAELLRTDLYDRLAAKTQTAQYLGKDMLDGVACHHVGLTQEDMDLEIWIDAGDQPQIRKISMVYKHEPARPRYTMLVIYFGTKPVSNDEFVATIPADASKVALLPQPANEESAQ